MKAVDPVEKRRNPARRRLLAWGAFLWLAWLAVPAQALVVTVDLGWGYYGNQNTDLGQYALQEGSIVQVIMFNSGTAAQPGIDANDNFTYFGDYTGAGIPGEPYYPGADPSHVPTETTIYDPNSAPAGHLIAYTTTIGPSTGGNANGYNWYNIYAQFQVLGTYDSLYIRVFGATEWQNGNTVASYWGISSVQSNGGVIGTWYVLYDDVTASNHVNYFEVIPEPGTLSLLALGGAGLCFVQRRRKNRRETS